MLPPTNGFHAHTERSNHIMSIYHRHGKNCQHGKAYDSIVLLPFLFAGIGIAIVLFGLYYHSILPNIPMHPMP